MFNVGRNFLLMLTIPLIYLKCTERLDEPLMCVFIAMVFLERRKKKRDGLEICIRSALYILFLCFVNKRALLCAVHPVLTIPLFSLWASLGDLI